MSELNDVVAEFDKDVNDPLVDSIPYEKVKNWMRSQDVEVLGAVADLISGERQQYLRIKPYLSLEDYHRFYMNYYERCFKDNPNGQWASSRYLAGASLVRWFVHLWNDSETPKSIPAELKSWLAKVYSENNEEVQDCIVTSTLEHLFEDEKIQAYFSDWEKDSILKVAYDEAKENAKGFRELGGSGLV
jgi:glutaredoxin 2